MLWNFPTISTTRTLSDILLQQFKCIYNPHTHTHTYIQLRISGMNVILLYRFYARPLKIQATEQHKNKEKKRN